MSETTRTNNKVFLSIDLDYWGICQEVLDNPDSKLAQPFVAKLIRMSEDEKNPLPLYVVESHEEMLPIVNKYPSNELWNVDFHSDFSVWKEKKQAKRKPFDGDWVNFVQWAKQGKYVWIPPKKECYQNGYGPGTCDGQWDPFWKTMITEYSPKLNGKKPYTNWLKAVVRDGESIRRTLVPPQRLQRVIPWNQLTAAAIAISPHWLQLENMKPVLEMLGVYVKTVKARKKCESKFRSRTTGTIKPTRRKS